MRPGCIPFVLGRLHVHSPAQRTLTDAGTQHCMLQNATGSRLAGQEQGESAEGRGAVACGLRLGVLQRPGLRAAQRASPFPAIIILSTRITAQRASKAPKGAAEQPSTQARNPGGTMNTARLAF
jgi:hypothetical protein